MESAVARQRTEGAVPFSNGTEVDWFQSGRCNQDDGYCMDFLPVMLGEWPDIIVPSDDTPLGVDCSKYERGEPAE